MKMVDDVVAVALGPALIRVGNVSRAQSTFLANSDQVLTATMERSHERTVIPKALESREGTFLKS